MWYAPKRIPSTVEPDRLSGNVRSVNVVDSVALAKTKEFPVPATATQSICRCQFETSIPERPVWACAVFPVASTATETRSTQKSAARTRFLWLAATSGMVRSKLASACLDAVSRESACFSRALQGLGRLDPRDRPGDQTNG